ncbi:PucR family transcriptional regulator ligand-binding domain-containing protein [Allostreptomyces psammosilenae]|uniref:PucR family transcriptional regulator n=1 Tax=Allostreptomyces psammosilenae TaxID=1892865 RepID=A0A853A4E9_9ACTN|nr:PucR family transcriptional regulator ligand-binding domain-containing protein [Allostreptomyces psammosilenae]NYI08340.1 hypothetical protein [Allostreptomyces psammosilenae]
MRLAALLEEPALQLRLVVGAEELDRAVRSVMVTDLRNPGRYLRGGELVLSGLRWHSAPEDSEEFVRILAECGVAALAAGEAEVGPPPQDLVDACRRHRLPLLTVPEAVAFASVSEFVIRRTSAERAADLAAVVERHRMLLSAPFGGGVAAVLRLLAADLDLRCWVLTATGLCVAGPGDQAPEPVAGVHPAEAPGTPVVSRRGPTGVRLARAYLDAEYSGRPAPHPARSHGRSYALVPVPAPGNLPNPRNLPDPGILPDPSRPGGRPRPRPGRAGRPDWRLTGDWFLAVEGDPAEWSEQRVRLVGGVAELAAAERARREEHRLPRRRLARQVVTLLAADADPAELAVRVAASGARIGHPAAGGTPWLVISATAQATGFPAPSADALRDLLEDALADLPGPVLVGTATPPAPPAPHAATRSAVPAGATAGTTTDAPTAPGAPTGPGTPSPSAATAPPLTVSGGGECLALVPLPGGSDTPAEAAPDDARDTGALDAGALEERLRPLENALGATGRLIAGVSGAVVDVEALRGALEEARYARRVAATRPGRVCVAGHDELASHVLLLPGASEEVRRSFRRSLVEPLERYDAQHRSELLPTLAAFLDCDGSWTRTAARLHVHVNTLRYRVSRIERLTGRDLARLEDKVDFFLALRMR